MDINRYSTERELLYAILTELRNVRSRLDDIDREVAKPARDARYAAQLARQDAAGLAWAEYREQFPEQMQGRIHNALRWAGLSPDDVRVMDDAELSRVRNLGPKGVAAVRAVLR